MPLAPLAVTWFRLLLLRAESVWVAGIAHSDLPRGTATAAVRATVWHKVARRSAGGPRPRSARSARLLIAFAG
jgi:hypothetical protein